MGKNSLAGYFYPPPHLGGVFLHWGIFTGGNRSLVNLYRRGNNTLGTLHREGMEVNHTAAPVKYKKSAPNVTQHGVYLRITKFINKRLCFCLKEVKYS